MEPFPFLPQQVNNNPNNTAFFSPLSPDLTSTPTQHVVVLNGSGLTVEQVHKVVHENWKVEVHPTAWARLYKTREFLFEAGKTQSIYGLNTGLGGVKDAVISPEEYAQWNRDVILSHCTAVNPEASESVVRAGMVARLNTLLVGCTGVSPSVVEFLVDLLNFGIHPVIPERGSIGCGDITSLAHIGLTIIGEGEVNYNGQRRTARDALKMCGLIPAVLGPKDALSILSSNAWSAGMAANTLYELKKLVNCVLQVASLSLEGFYGNVTPLDASVNRARGFLGQQQAAEIMRTNLEGSYLYEKRIGKETLQDPLCYRCTPHVIGALLDAMQTAENQLNIQLNSSDDNPCLLPDEDKVLSCGNFDSLGFILPFQALGVALAHVSRASALRITKLNIPSFTGLTPFLGPKSGKNIMGYGIFEHSATSLDAEVRHLANPSSIDSLVCSIGMEDQASNGPLVVKNITKIIDNIYYIISIELLMAAQAVDLREISTKLGTKTSELYQNLRSKISFLDELKGSLHEDLNKVYKLLKIVC